ncbi:hypothetical protein VNO77_07348 [Canavalia gladiata]|uniref:Uncharacterized protein n=1 Tax=Canavalia gladiata TaxID=3824 RepID=A0AAN9QWK8_CANGL
MHIPSWCAPKDNLRKCHGSLTWKSTKVIVIVIVPSAVLVHSSLAKFEIFQMVPILISEFLSCSWWRMCWERAREVKMAVSLVMGHMPAYTLFDRSRSFPRRRTTTRRRFRRPNPSIYRTLL